MCNYLIVLQNQPLELLYTKSREITPLAKNMNLSEKNPAAVALGRLGGQTKTEKKKKAAQANGKKGGRPKKKLIV